VIRPSEGHWYATGTKWNRYRVIRNYNYGMGNFNNCHRSYKELKKISHFSLQKHEKEAVQNSQATEAT